MLCRLCSSVVWAVCNSSPVAHTQLLRVSTGPRHVSVRQFVPLPVHVHGGCSGSLLRGLLRGAPAPFPERSAAPTQVQPVLPPHDGTGQHPAHHRDAPHGRRAEGRRRCPGQPRFWCHPGFHIGSDQPLVHHVLRLGSHVPKNLHGERRRQRAAEHPAAGQRARLQSGQVTERVPLGLFSFISSFFYLNTPPASRLIGVM